MNTHFSYPTRFKNCICLSCTMPRPRRGLATAKEGHKLTGLQDSPKNLSFSADGKTIAAVASDGASIRVWDHSMKDDTRCAFRHDAGAVISRRLTTSTQDGKTAMIWNIAAAAATHKK
jgi:WD40 repeat protein